MRGHPRMQPKSVMFAEGFEALAEAMEAKVRMMRAWKALGMDYTAAVLRYADEFGVDTIRAAQRIDDMELLTGIRFERSEGCGNGW
jgi:hypothetical protein